jgi:hypothetical protein
MASRPDRSVRPAVVTQMSAMDADLPGAEIVFGPELIGHVEGLLRDPLSHRILWLVTRYGPNARRVAVPKEWVVRCSSARLVLGVGRPSLHDLPDQADPRRSHQAMASPA